jgi:Flp pilus assembly protein TadG
VETALLVILFFAVVFGLVGLAERFMFRFDRKRRLP